MRKITLSLLAMILFSIASYAQYDRISFRTDLSLGLSAGDYKLSSQTLKSKTIVGYRLYAGVDIPVKGRLVVNPGIGLQLKGANIPIEDLKTSTETLKDDLLKPRFLNLIVPINVGYHLPLTSSVALSLYTGPYFSIAVDKSMKVVFEKSSFKDYEHQLTELTKSELSAWDMGWGASACVGINLFYVTVGADFGFIDMIRRSGVDATMRNVSYHFGAGIRL